jgi:hypothetical protein
MPPRPARRSRPPGKRYVLVIDTCAETRGALLERLAADGFQSIGTTSIHTACALLQAPQVKLVLVNLSAFSAEALGQLGRALRRRGEVRVLAVVSQISMAGAPPIDAGARVADGRSLERGEGAAKFLLRLSGPAQLTLGLHPCHPN